MKKRLRGKAAGSSLLLGLALLQGGCSGSVTNAGPANPGQAAISVSPSSAAFGNQPAGTTSAPQSVTATNTGTATLTISSISISPSEFKLQSGPAAPLSVGPGASAVFTLAFAPDGAQTFSGELTFTSNASTSPTAVALSGSGTVVGTLAITTTSLPSATASANYLAFLQATGGTGSLTWSQSGLPSPLAFDAATGTISGVAPATTGSTSFTVQVTDSSTPAQVASQALTLTVAAATGADCNSIFIDVGNTSPPPNSPGPHVIPLNDLGTGTYLSQLGGLYPNGSNTVPTDHLNAGVSLANAVQPLDANGNVDPTNGKMVLISIGMSNTSLEFSKFISDVAGDASLNSQLVIVNGAQSGFDAPQLLDPNEKYWQNIRNSILPAAGATNNQVVAAWVKEAIASQTGPFPGDAQTLQADLETIAKNLLINFPNIKQAYFASRIYAGYATTSLNPEPIAYESGFAVKWTVQDQINGVALNFDPGKGAVVAPWVAWGPYFWANGLLPRSDGVVWTCQDLQSDGTHPSASGQEKVSQMLIGFFKTDPTTTPWFLKH